MHAGHSIHSCTADISRELLSFRVFTIPKMKQLAAALSLSAEKNISATATSPVDVQKAYQDGLAEQSSNPDKLIWDAKEFTPLDSNLVVLTEDTPSPRVATPTMVYGFACWCLLLSGSFCVHHLRTLNRSGHGRSGVTNPTDGAPQIAVFLFAFAIAPLFLAPISEI